MSEIERCWDAFVEQAAEATRALEEKQTKVGDALQRLLEGATQLTSITAADPPHESDRDATADFRTRLGSALSSIHEGLSVCLGEAIGKATHSRFTQRFEGAHFDPVASSHKLSAVVGQVSEHVSEVFDKLSRRSTAKDFQAALKEADSVADEVALAWLAVSLESAVEDKSEREAVLENVGPYNIWDTAVKGARERWDVMQGKDSKPESDFWAYFIWNDEEPRPKKGKEVYREPPMDDSERGPDVSGDSRDAERDGSDFFGKPYN